MKIKSVQKKSHRTPAETARLKALREKYQREKPGPEDCDDLMPLGLFLEMQALLQNLKKQRELAGLTLADVARLTDIDQAALSRLENGKQSNPTVSTLSRYSAAVGKGIAWMIVDLPNTATSKRAKRSKAK